MIGEATHGHVGAQPGSAQPRWNCVFLLDHLGKGRAERLSTAVWTDFGVERNPLDCLDLDFGLLMDLRLASFPATREERCLCNAMRFPPISTLKTRPLLG